jgi:DNA gyrase subunit A
VMLISTAGTVIKMPVDDIKRSGRSTQGVIVMRFKADDERVSAVAPVVESDEDDAVSDQAEESAPEVGSLPPQA